MAKGARAYFTVVKAPDFSKAFDEGLFTSAQSEMRKENQELAQVLQGRIGLLVRNSLKRPKVSTNRLIRVTVDPKNRRADTFYMGVGNREFLDGPKSIAKYWRTIEEGSKATWTKRAFTSLPLQGFWGTTLGKFNYGPSGDWVSVQRPFGDTAGRGQSMYQPFRIGRGGKRSRLPIFTPGHDIAPMNAYKTVGEDQFMPREMIFTSQKFFERVLSWGIQGEGFRGGIYDLPSD